MEQAAASRYWRRPPQPEVVCRFVCRTWNQLLVLRTRTMTRAGTTENMPQGGVAFSVQVAYQGWLAVLQWARNLGGCPWRSAIYRAAARGNHFEVLRWAHENRMSAPAAQQLAAGISSCCSRGCLWDGTTMWEAAVGMIIPIFSGREERHVRSSLADGPPFPSPGGHLEVLQWAHSQGCPSCNPDTLDEAAGWFAVTMMC